MQTQPNQEKFNLKPCWLDLLQHHVTRDFVSNPYPKLGEVVTITLEIPPDAELEQVVLRTIPNGEQQLIAMALVASERLNQGWQAELLINEPRVAYRFGVQTAGRVYWFNAAGITERVPLGFFDFKLLANTPEIPWLPESVFYQIFPDRFANGDPSNDPVNEEVEVYPGVTRNTYPWGELPALTESRKHFPFYGGDLAGIQAKLAYLQELGVNALYLNPIFTAYTNHRYDVADFRNVDPVLGGNEALVSLSKALKQRHMRFILDIVPNHSGAGHPWFREAINDPASQKRSAFYFNEGNDYASWMGFGSLPKLNYRDPQLREEMFASQTSVFAHWLKPPYEADGWRVDVGNMLGRYDADQLDGEILPAIRKTVKDAEPESYLIGENFFDAISQLQGEVWDGVMNYSGFSEPFLHWLKPFRVQALRCEVELRSELPISTESLIDTWRNHLAAIPYSIALQQFNLLGSHDTPRLAAVLDGDYDLIRLAIMVQFTFPGIPCIYYGDEIGLKNEEGFGSRNCFPWDESKWDQDLFSFYQKMIQLRRGSETLAQGSFKILRWDEESFLFQRQLGEERLWLSAHRQASALGSNVSGLCMSSTGDFCMRGLFSGKTIEVREGKLYLPPMPRGGEIWLQASGSE